VRWFYYAQMQKQRKHFSAAVGNASKLFRISFVITIVSGLLGCNGSSPSEPIVAPTAAATAAPVQGEPALLKPPVAKTFTSGLNTPWGMTFLPDGRILVTEKGGTIRIVSADGRVVSASISGVPKVDSAAGQGGLLDVEIDPNFSSNRRVYWSYSEPGSGADTNKNGTAVARGELNTDATGLSNVTVIFRQVPKVASQGHFGSRIVFGTDGMMWVALGDRQVLPDQAQNLANHIGKVVRINTDGVAPAGNPFVDTAGAAKEIFTLGHRNIQGAARHPITGDLWTNEHGPQGGDEVNREVAGKNYGWPVISYGQSYGTTQQIGVGTSKAGLEQPLTYWEALDGSTPAQGAAKSSMAPSGMMFYTGTNFPEWQGSLFIGALAGKSAWRVTLNENRLTGRERLFSDLNERIRAIKQGPDGWIYLLTDSASGRIVRVER
jgi:aldose sugar dehydrogenase